MSEHRIIGCVARTLRAERNPYRVFYFIIQYFFIVAAPVFLAAAIYAVPSILIRVMPNGKSHAPLQHKLMIWVFITCDVVATVVQIVGAALTGVAYSNQRDPTKPDNIPSAELASRAIAYSVLVFLLGAFIWRATKDAFHAISKAFFVSLPMTVMLIYLRVYFRLAETAQGPKDKVKSHEAYFGTLEFIPVALVLELLPAWHPGKCVQSSASTASNFV